MVSKNEYCPDYAVPPGATLQEIIETRGMTQAKLAGLMNRPKKTINEIVNGKAAITPETAIQLERVLQVDADFWNALESNYRANLARIAEKERLLANRQWLKLFPVRKMEQYGWIKQTTDPALSVDRMLTFFAVASVEAWQLHWARINGVAFRKSETCDVPQPALAAWLRRGEIQANDITARSYNRKGFQSGLREIRSALAQPLKGFLPELQRICADNGVAVVLVRELPKVPVSGITRWPKPDRAIIQLDFRYKTADQFWFSFFHEAGHVVRHANRDFAFEEKNEPWEREADEFAADTLIDKAAYAYFTQLHKHRFSEDDVLAFAESQNVPPGIVVGRLQHDKLLSFKSPMNKLKQKLSWGKEIA